MPTPEPDTTSAAPVGLASPSGAGAAGEGRRQAFLPSLADIIFICTSVCVLLLCRDISWAKTAMRRGIYALAATYWRTVCRELNSCSAQPSASLPYTSNGSPR